MLDHLIRTGCQRAGAVQCGFAVRGGQPTGFGEAHDGCFFGQLLQGRPTDYFLGKSPTLEETTESLRETKEGLLRIWVKGCLSLGRAIGMQACLSLKQQYHQSLVLWLLL